MTDEELAATIRTVRGLTAAVEAIEARMMQEQRDLRHEITPIMQQMVAMVERQLEDPDLNERQRQQFEEMKRDFLQWPN